MRRKERIDRPIKVLTDGIYALSSGRHLLYLLGPRVAPVLILIALVVAVPNLYIQRVIAIAAVYALLALSWDFLAGTTGLISLGQALFFGVGAYATAIGNTLLGLPPVVSVLVSPVVAGAFCTGLLVPCLGLRGIYFSMTTLVYPLLLARVVEATRVLGGTDGILGVAPLAPWLERSIVVVMLLGGVIALRRLLATDLGLVLRAIGDDDLAVHASGIDVKRYQIIAIFISATLGAFAGAYFTHLYMVVGISAFALDLSILPIAAAVLGGIGTLVGPVLGAMILVPLSEAARDLGSLRMVVYSVLLVMMILWKPEGFLSFFRRKYEQVERWVDV